MNIHADFKNIVEYILKLFGDIRNTLNLLGIFMSKDVANKII